MYWFHEKGWTSLVLRKNSFLKEVITLNRFMKLLSFEPLFIDKLSLFNMVFVIFMLKDLPVESFWACIASRIWVLRTFLYKFNTKLV